MRRVRGGVLVAPPWRHRFLNRFLASLRWLMRHTLVSIALIAVIVWFVSGILFSLVEGVDIWHALYWSLVTITTVGYGDIVPETVAGKLIASLTIVAGIAVFMAFVSVAAGSIVEAAERRRRGYITYRGRNHIVVVGWTPAAEAAIRALKRLELRRDIVLVTEKPSTVLADTDIEGIVLVRGDLTRRETLLRANIPRAAMVIISTDDDAKTVLITLSVKTLNPRARIVAEALHPESIELLHKAGADIVVPTRLLGGKLLASSLSEPAPAMIIEEASKEAAPEIEFHEIPAAHFAGKTYLQALLELRREGATLVAIRRGGRLIHNPPDDTIIKKDDILVIVTSGYPPRRGEERPAIEKAAS